MTLPVDAFASKMSLSMINQELGFSAAAKITFNDAAVRSLLSVSTGMIAMYDAFGATLRVIPAKPNLAYVSATNTSITVSFSANSSGLAAPDSYRFDVYLYNNSVLGSKVMTYTGVLPSPKELTGLVISNNYLIFAYAVNPAGDSPSAYVVAHTSTDQTIPSAPAVSLNSKTANSVTVNFSATSSGLAAPTYFTVYIFDYAGSVLGSIVASQYNAVSPQLLSGLLSAHQYFVYISAGNLAGSNASSFIFTTN